MTPDKNPNYP
jgi:hypothetical protein